MLGVVSPTRAEMAPRVTIGRHGRSVKVCRCIQWAPPKSTPLNPDAQMWLTTTSECPIENKVSEMFDPADPLALTDIIGREAHGQERVKTRRPASEDDRVDLPSSSSSIPIDARTENTRQCDACRTWQSQKEEMESIVKQRCQEAYQLDLELQSATKRLAEWEESYAKLEQRLKFSVAQADERIAETSWELQRVEKENRELRRVEKENQELRQVEKENQMLHDEGIKMQRQLEQLTKQSERREENLHKSQKLLESRTEELKLAQTFLTTADQHSIADVCHMVNQLNEEIYQCTMMMSDALIEQRGLQGREDEDKAANRQGACERAELRWGKALASRLQADVANDETTLLESLLQHALMRWCYEIVQSFSLESREFDNRFLALWDSIAQACESPSSLQRAFSVLAC